MKFGKFVAQFVREIDELENRGRGLHNADIVDMIWKKVLNAKLIQYAIALKFQFQRIPRNYQLILQNISSHIPTLTTSLFWNTFKVNTIPEEDKGCLESRAHDDQGNLFIGKYPFRKWVHEYVRPFWKEIKATRSTNRRGGSADRSLAGKKRMLSYL